MDDGWSQGSVVEKVLLSETVSTERWSFNMSVQCVVVCRAPAYLCTLQISRSHVTGVSCTTQLEWGFLCINTAGHVKVRAADLLWEDQDKLKMTDRFASAIFSLMVLGLVSSKSVSKSGLQVEVTREVNCKDNQKAQNGDRVTVHYGGFLQDGKYHHLLLVSQYL